MNAKTVRHGTGAPALRADMEAYGSLPDGRRTDREDHRGHHDTPCRRHRAHEKFTVNGEVVTFDGFLKVYRESSDDDENSGEMTTNQLPPMAEGDTLQRGEMVSTERFSQGPQRYTEASLVHKMEELGIGRLQPTHQPSAPYSSEDTCRKATARATNALSPSTR